MNIDDQYRDIRSAERAAARAARSISAQIERMLANLPEPVIEHAIEQTVLELAKKQPLIALIVVTSDYLRFRLPVLIKEQKEAVRNQTRGRDLWLNLLISGIASRSRKEPFS